MRRRGTTNLDDIRRTHAARDGAVPGRLLHLPRDRDPARASTGSTARRPPRRCASFLQERWKGVWPILYGDQLRQARLDDWIFQGLLDVEHLPDERGAGMSHHDVVVVGTGLAGLTAAVRLAESGARVLVLAKGVGATHLSGGTIDVLGYAPERVERPADALPGFLAEHPGHPYAPRRRGRDRRGDRVVQGPRRERLARPVRLHRLDRREPAAADGGRRAAALGGRAGDDGARRPARAAGRCCVVGLPRAQGLLSGAPRRHACARERRRDRARRRARPRARGARGRQLARVRAGDSTIPPSAARSSAQVARPQARAPRSGSAFPAVLGIADPHGVWTALEHALGRPVFEVPTLPPSVPGMRVFAILREALRRAGGRVRAQQRGGRRRARRRPRARAARRGSACARSGAAPTGSCSRPAASRPAGSSSTRAGPRARRRSGCRVRGVPGPGEERFRPGYFDAHPMARAGVAVDGELRPVDAEGAGAGERAGGRRDARRRRAVAGEVRRRASASPRATARPSWCSPPRQRPARRPRPQGADRHDGA